MEDQKQKLLKKAKNILANNWKELSDGTSFTKPSTKLYPFQWNWDSGFTAYGLYNTIFTLVSGYNSIRRRFNNWRSYFH